MAAHSLKKQLRIDIPVLPLRGLIVFPETVIHFDVGRESSIHALDTAMNGDQELLLITQRDAQVDDPTMADLYPFGTLGVIKQILKLPGDRMRVLVEGKARAKLRTLTLTEGCLLGSIAVVPAKKTQHNTVEMAALIRSVREAVDYYSKVSGQLSPESLSAILAIDNPGQLADVLAANLLEKLEEKQKILEMMDEEKRLQKVYALLLRETEIAEAEKDVQAHVREQMEQNQRDYYLREQIKAIQTELGDVDSSKNEELKERIQNTPLNDEACEKALREVEKLERMAPGSPEISLSETYVEWILSLPWGKDTPDQLDLKRARQILEEDHFGLKEVKERVIEYLAVCKIRKNLSGPILCFVGPPGVGKTSVAKSIARALGRSFVQMSLGGVRDEAEIRGHRRTYIGAIPGRIISSMRQAGTMNPVFLLDEIDKVGADVRGDPASALLEVLDSAQNNTFRDHYLEIPFDLSHVLFITTANTTDTIPRPLLDRMEVIEIESYTEEDKLNIAKRYLLPNQIIEHGLAPKSVRMNERILRKVINNYTREAGVRVLQRTIGKLVRKSAVEMLDTDSSVITIDNSRLLQYLGVPKFTFDKATNGAEIGVVTGLAWTPVGGDTLKVEVAVTPGTGALELTGNLGDVMKESAKAARTWVRSHAAELGIKDDFYKTTDIHVHVPEGAIPKDGPSAGITITTALVSALTGNPVRQDVAMTGEVTLRGRVLPIGGLKEKLLAAHRAGIKTVLIPTENKKDLESIPENVLNALTIYAVSCVEEVLPKALSLSQSEEKRQPYLTKAFPAGFSDVEPTIKA